MAESLGTSVLELDGDLSPLERKLAAGRAKAGAAGRATGKSFQDAIARPLQRAALPAAVVFGAIVLGAKKVVGAAVDMNETLNKTRVVFGDQFSLIEKWSEGLAQAFGISKQQGLDAIAIFGTFGKAAGLTGKGLTAFSKPLVEAAGDLASFHNIPVDQALEDIRSGLVGEVEPLRKFGILLNDARLREEALRQGLVKNTKEALSPQNKMLAAQALILRDLGPAQGDAAKTIGEAAGQARVQAAETANLNAKIGKGLIPAYEVLQGLLLGVTSFMGKHTDAAKIAVGVIAGLAALILVANAAIKLYGIVTGIATAATWLFSSSATAAGKSSRVMALGVWLMNTALYANPIVLVVAALVLLGVALIVAYKKFERFRNVIKAVLGWVKSNWPKIALIIAGPFAPLVLLATDAFGIRSKLLRALRGIITGAKDIARRIGSGIKDGIVGGLRGLASAAGGVVRAAVNAIIGSWNRLAIPSFSRKIGVGPASVTLSTPRIDLPDIPYLHSGGIVPGQRGSDVPIIARAGEGVFTKEQMRALGSRGPLVHIERQEINRDVDIDFAVAALGRKLAVRL